MQKTLSILIFAVAQCAPVFAQQLYRNPYASPYSSGGSWSDGRGDYNDTTNRYGSRMGGPTIYSERENATYECSSSGRCFKAWDGL
jgi:hypothetical protein